MVSGKSVGILFLMKVQVVRRGAVLCSANRSCTFDGSTICSALHEDTVGFDNPLLVPHSCSWRRTKAVMHQFAVIKNISLRFQLGSKHISIPKCPYTSPGHFILRRPLCFPKMLQSPHLFPYLSGSNTQMYPRSQH